MKVFMFSMTITIDGKIHPLIKSNFCKKFQGGGGRKLSYHHQMVKIFFLFRKKLKGVNELLLVLYQAQEALSSFFFGSIRVMLL